MNLIHIDTKGFEVFSLFTGSSVNHCRKIDMMTNKAQNYKTITSLINPRCIQGLNLIQDNGGWCCIVISMSGGEVSDLSFKVGDSFLNEMLDEILSKERSISNGSRDANVYQRSKVKVHSLFMDKLKKSLMREDENIILAELFKESICECFQDNG